MRFPPFFSLLGIFSCLSGIALAQPIGPEEEPPAVRNILWEGNTAFSSATLTARIPLKPQKPLQPSDVKFSLHMIESLYQDKGHYRVSVSSDIIPINKKQTDVLFRIREGPLHYVGGIQIEGNREISHHIILRNLGIKTGDVFSQSKVFEGNRQLYMTGYFSSIDVNYSTAPAHRVNIAIRVKERATKFLKGAVGYGSLTKESVKLGYEDMN